MMVRKVIAGSALAAGLSVAGMLSAGTASALGFAVDPAGPNNSFSVGTASANVGDGNNGLAVSIFRPASVTANKNSTGNNLVAVDGSVDVNGASSNNNNVVVVGGDVKLAGNNNHNTVLSLGSNVSTKGDTAGQFSASVCGTSFSGQASKVTVSPGVC